MGLPWWLRQWRNCWGCRRPRFDLWVGKIPWKRAWHPSILAWRITCTWSLLFQPGTLMSKTHIVSGMLLFKKPQYKQVKWLDFVWSNMWLSLVWHCWGWNHVAPLPLFIIYMCPLRHMSCLCPCLCSLFGSIKFWWKAPSGLDLILHPRAAVAGVQPSCKRCCYVLATAAAAGENTPIGKWADLTSILRMMSNLGPGTWSSDLCWGPLGHDGGVCTCAFTCMRWKWPSCWSGQASQGVIIKLNKKEECHLLWT